MDLELLFAKNFTFDNKHFLEDFVRKDENNSLKFGANNEPDLTQFIEDLEGRIIGRQSEISIYCFYSILCLYIVVILIGSEWSVNHITDPQPTFSSRVDNRSKPQPTIG